MSLIRKVKTHIKDLQRFIYYLKLNSGKRVKIFNTQLESINGKLNIDDFWFSRFLIEKNIFKKNLEVTFISVNGNKIPSRFIPGKYKIFYTFENVHVYQSPWELYKDQFLQDKRINLSIGFDYLNNSNYIRFPYWIVTMFKATDTFYSIQNICKTIENNKNNLIRERFCAFICRYDYFGDRAKFADEISEIAPLNYPGKFRHNDDSLLTYFNNNKIEYLKQFKFNLCPENSNNNGYVTEKIFDAIKAGCIPIYWGSGNKPESDILNQNRILFLKLNGDNSEVIQKIKQLNEDENAYREFINQPVFSPNAPEIIYGYFERLEQKLREIIK